MKKFIVDTGKKKYNVEANDAEHAVKLIKKINDEASQLQTVNALIEDEKAAVEAYDVAIENLRGKIPEESLQAIIAIRDDENRHIENLQAVVNGTVTEKNLEDSMMNDNNAYVIFKQNGEWKGTSEENYNARIQNARTILTFKGMRNKEDVIEYMNKYMGGMNNVRIIDSMINDGIKECHEALGQAKDAISMIYKNYAKEQDSAYMLAKLNEASSAIAKAIRHYKAWML